MALAFPPEPVGLAESALLRLDIAGVESNLCIGLSRLVVGARFISRVGDDPFGLRIRQVLAQEGIDTSALMTDLEAPTGVFFRENLPDRQRRVYYYRKGSAASRICPDDLHPDLFQGSRIVHLTGITPALSPSCAAACQRLSIWPIKLALWFPLIHTSAPACGKLVRLKPHSCHSCHKRISCLWGMKMPRRYSTFKSMRYPHYRCNPPLCTHPRCTHRPNPSAWTRSGGFNRCA
jgi:hypothetical protein